MRPPPGPRAKKSGFRDIAYVNVRVIRDADDLTGNFFQHSAGFVIYSGVKVYRINAFTACQLDGLTVACG
jgi:hypothetical protein